MLDPVRNHWRIIDINKDSREVQMSRSSPAAAELRNPKPEGRKKPEARDPKLPRSLARCFAWPVNSQFVFRASAANFKTPKSPQKEQQFIPFLRSFVLFRGYFCNCLSGFFRPSAFGFRPSARRHRVFVDIKSQAAHSTSPTVARMTSSGVVNPARTLRIPSSRRVRMPISRARLRRTEEETFS
jgi:hypothetical protein